MLVFLLCHQHKLSRCISYKLNDFLESFNLCKCTENALNCLLILMNFTMDYFLLQVYEDEPVLQAFKVMRKKRVGGVPVIKRGGNMPIGNISLRDVQFLLTAPEIYHDYRYIADILNCDNSCVTILDIDCRDIQILSCVLECSRGPFSKTMVATFHLIK